MPDIQLHKYRARIEGLIRGDRQDEAIAHCEHILHFYPKYIQAYRLLGQACLAKGELQQARECFQRALSADPENLTAWIGLGNVYAHQDMLPEAIWSMERALTLAPGHADLRQGLQGLYARRDGAQQIGGGKAALKLTQDALGRLHARNGLYEDAISEYRAVLCHEPDLPDIRVALVEALWHGGRHLEATEVCLEILKQLPHCLKANLVLGAVRLASGHEDAGKLRLDVARALDPENLVAQQMMGRESPLPLEEVFIPVSGIEGTASLTGEPLSKGQAFAEAAPHWVRELQNLGGEQTAQQTDEMQESL
ncbi:tetratricopeptide repeat protein [Chloroflexota bacterium]